MNKSTVSFDFTWVDDYDAQLIEEEIFRALEDADVEPTALDFYSVDYSDYPEYSDVEVSQCGVDFEWDNEYDEETIQEYIEDAMKSMGYEVIGVMFESI